MHPLQIFTIRSMNFFELAFELAMNYELLVRYLVLVF